MVGGLYDGSITTGNADAGNPANHTEDTDTDADEPDTAKRTPEFIAPARLCPARDTVGAGISRAEAPSTVNLAPPSADPVTVAPDTAKEKLVGAEASANTSDSATESARTCSTRFVDGHTSRYVAVDPATVGVTAAVGEAGSKPIRSVPVVTCSAPPSEPVGPNDADHEFARVFHRAAVEAFARVVSIGVHDVDPLGWKNCGAAYWRTVSDPSSFCHVADRAVRRDTSSLTGFGFLRAAAGKSPGPTGAATDRLDTVAEGNNANFDDDDRFAARWTCARPADAPPEGTATSAHTTLTTATTAAHTVGRLHSRKHPSRVNAARFAQGPVMINPYPR